MMTRLRSAASNLRIGESTAANDGSRESTVDLTGDDGDDGDGGDYSDLPNFLEDLFSQAKAMRRMAISEPGQILTHFGAVGL